MNQHGLPRARLDFSDAECVDRGWHFLDFTPLQDSMATARVSTTALEKASTVPMKISDASQGIGLWHPCRDSVVYEP